MMQNTSCEIPSISNVASAVLTWKMGQHRACAAPTIGEHTPQSAAYPSEVIRRRHVLA